MQFGPQQQEAIDLIRRWLADPSQQVFKLFGCAGTGKTTLARHIAEMQDGTVRFAAFTGKAAHVLTTKGCPATTIHKLIYLPKMASKKKLIELKEQLATTIAEEGPESPAAHELKAKVRAEEENSERTGWRLNLDSVLRYDCELLIVDEVSMVNGEMGEDLLEFGCKILVLGDPAQLPPVRGTGYFMNDPDFMLTEIHRQAKESPIIQLATMARNREFIPAGDYGHCRVIDVRPGEKITDLFMEADQILCGRNRTRRGINNRVRELKGFNAELPVTGDRMICLRNDGEAAVLNGQMWEMTADAQSMEDMYLAEMKCLDVDRQATFEVWARQPEWYETTEALEFDFAYAVTVHKSQGSQWDHVVLMDESPAFGRDKWKHLYTGITRAAERLDIVRMSN